MKKIFSLLLTLCIFILPTNVLAESFSRGVLTGDEVSVRTSPSYSASLVKTDTGSGIYLYKPESVEVIGTSGEWYQIRFLYSGFTYTGYINGRYLSVTTVELDSNYENTLRSKGFPETYIKKLSKLHSLHPEWDFEVSNTNLDWNTSVYQESIPINKSLIQSGNATLRSTEDGAYSNGTYTQYGSGWYAASRQTIGYFMDPRNFLDEGHVFMFESLVYDPSKQDSSTVSKVLENTFMNGTFDYNNQAWTYSNAFIKAAQTYNVSPVHLATRARQEQGTSCSALSCGTGYNGQYVGYYNFYNIGASGSNDYDIIMSGLKYAYDRGWNNPYLSIVNGSSLLGNDYIGNGQVTLYYEKFNTISSPLYYNQYMQNVKAPYSEAYSTYSSYYKAGAMDSPFIFKIPIYNNMPEATTLSTAENSTNTLSSLSVSNCDLNPSFTSSATNYTCNVLSGVSEVEVTANKTSIYSSMSGTGKVSLNDKTTTVTVSVKAANGNVKNYVITINKASTGNETPNEIISSIGYNNNNNIVSKISVGEDISNIISKIKSAYPSASIQMKDKNNNIKENGVVSTNDKIILTNNNQTVEYSVVIYGDISGDGVIDIADLLKVQKHIKGVSTLSDNYLKAADTNKDGIIDIGDLLKIQKDIKGVSKIEQ